MTVTHGNDPDVLDGIGDALRAQAERMQTIAATGTTGVAALVEAWAGPDVDVFGANWRGAQQQLDSACQLLRAVGEQTKEQAQQQRDASGEGGGSRGPTTPFDLGPPNADRTLPTPGAPGQMAVPIKHDVPPFVGGDGRPDPEAFQLPEGFDEDGPQIPFTGDNHEVPQGLAHFRGVDENGDPVDELVYTSYQYDPDDPDDTTHGEIVFMDRRTGEVTSRVPLEGIDHYGGVTVVGDYTYVSGGGRLQVYETSALRDPQRRLVQPEGPIAEAFGVEPYDVIDPATPINYGTTDAEQGELANGVPVDASSTVTSHDGDLYVTDWDADRPSTMYRYEIGPDGQPIRTGDEYTVPPQTQGVSFDEAGNAYYSRSHGRGVPSLLTRVSADDFASDGGWTWQNGEDVATPNMAEGSVIIDGQLNQLYESGSAKYDHYDHGPDALIELVAGELDPRERLTIHDLRN